MPLYAPTFAFVMNKDNTTRCPTSRSRRSTTIANTEAAGRVGEPLQVEDAGVDDQGAGRSRGLQADAGADGAVEEGLPEGSRLGRGRQENRRRSDAAMNGFAPLTKYTSRNRPERTAGGGGFPPPPSPCYLAVRSGHERASMDRFIDMIEWIAAGFVGIVALTFSCR